MIAIRPYCRCDDDLRLVLERKEERGELLQDNRREIVEDQQPLAGAQRVLRQRQVVSEREIEAKQAETSKSVRFEGFGEFVVPSQREVGREAPNSVLRNSS